MKGLGSFFLLAVLLVLPAACVKTYSLGPLGPLPAGPSPTHTPCAACTPTFTFTSTNTGTPTKTSTPSPTATLTFTATPTYTTTACGTPGSAGYDPAPGFYISAYNMVFVSPVTLSQAVKVDHFQVGLSIGVDFQTLIFADNGADYPGALLYQSSVVVPAGAGLFQVPVSPFFPLSAGKYWIGIASSALGALSTDGVPGGSFYLAYRQSAGFPPSVNLSDYSVFPSVTDPAFVINLMSGGSIPLGHIAVNLGTCGP